MSDTCIGAHHTEPPLTMPGLALCPRCHTQLHRALADIITLWPLLAVMLEPGNNGSGSTSSKPGSRPPCNLDVIDITDHRSQTSQQLTSWARVVIEDRALAPRTLDGEQAARLLTVHLEWLAAQPFADEAADEIHQAARTIRLACRDLPDPPIGRCPDIDPRGETDTCGGPLRWIDGSVSVMCSRCGSAWRADDLVNVGRVTPLNLWETVPHVAEMLDMPDRTLRHWVSSGKIRRNSLGQVRHADVWRHAHRENS